ncbi:RNA polymerase sigma-70 factor [Arcticibacter tournemirensis]|uniref:RNA polymerase sigma-70 factor n=1 Tax=Arcticibacter tournemirensis TaxID=699437 RepID=A0A4Q0M8N9_9SPHI|nr:RNA polymerase sigma-70 factor [Arcticibacter tournemirensis]RXF69086.1 RNA polymerase sigma-70 factor [Arcticibacter tournemirensis]
MRVELKLPESVPELVLAIRQRDKKVFEALYKSHFKGLYTLSYRYVGKCEVAEEIVHDVFISIWNKAGNVSIETSVKNYLIRSVINSSLNYIKKEKNDILKQEDYIASLNVAEDPEAFYMEREQLLLKLEKALELLPPQCRKVMIMSRFEKMKQQEIADNLNISIKTVKNHLTYGLNKLRFVLTETLILVLFFWIEQMQQL